MGYQRHAYKCKMRINYNKYFYNQLCDLANSMQLKLIKGRGNFKGGACLLKEESVIVINHNHPYEIRIISLGQCLIESEIDFSILNKKMKFFFKQIIEDKELNER